VGPTCRGHPQPPATPFLPTAAPPAGRPAASGRPASLCLHHSAINGAAATHSTASASSPPRNRPHRASWPLMAAAPPTPLYRLGRALSPSTTAL
jgi:hypothetical protein